MRLRLDRRDLGVAGATSMVVASLALLVSCGSGTPQLDDLKNSPPVYPNFSSTVVNVDNFPNISVLCYHGAGFATTTRDAAGALILVPEWDKFCQAQEGKQATQNGQP